MANITVGQIIMEAQKMASRVKELDALSSSLLEEAEGNNRFVESLRQFHDDMDSLNRVGNNKSNVDMVNRIQQQNANSSEILKENRELKICIEDYERAMELIMQKYREHTNSKVLESKLSFKEVYNEKLWEIIREQREKINEMAAVMQRAANIDDDEYDINLITRLRLENNTLRELLQISKHFGTYNRPMRFNDHLFEEKGIQTDLSPDDSADELSLSGASIENANNSIIQLNISSTSSISTACQPLTDYADLISFQTGLVADNNAAAVSPMSALPSTEKIASTVLSSATSIGSIPIGVESNVTSATFEYNNLNSSADIEVTSINTPTPIVANTAAVTSNSNSSSTNININSTANAT